MSTVTKVGLGSISKEFNGIFLSIKPVTITLSCHTLFLGETFLKISHFVKGTISLYHGYIFWRGGGVVKAKVARKIL